MIPKNQTSCTASGLRVGEVTGVQFELRAGSPVSSHDTLGRRAFRIRGSNVSNQTFNHTGRFHSARSKTSFPPWVFRRTSPSCSWPPYNQHKCWLSQQVTFATHCFVKSMGATLSFLTTLHDLPPDPPTTDGPADGNTSLAYPARDVQVRAVKVGHCR